MTTTTTTTATTSSRRRGQGGPPLLLPAGAFAALFVASLVALGVLGEGTFPSPFADADRIAGYVSGNRTALQVTGTLQFAAAVPLAVLAGTAASRLQHLGVRAPGVTIAFGGGTFSAAFLALSGLLQWTLARPAVQAEPGVVRALHDLTFVTGGPAHAVGLGLLVAGIAVPAFLLRLLPRWMGIAGLVIAVLAELSTLVLVAPAAAVLMPLSRFPGLLWLLGAAAALPRNRTNASATNPAATRR